MSNTLTGNPALVDPGFDAPPQNPTVLLRTWLAMADQLRISEPRGMVLSTVGKNGVPSSRVVLLKECDETGVVFATSADSQKGREMQDNPKAAGTLWWRETMQQITFSGTVTRCSSKFSDEVFHERPRAAQAVATVSKQSMRLIDEQALRDQVEALLQDTATLRRPERWFAYHLAIESIEFWHGSADRFHKRLFYKLLNGVWQNERLQP